MTAKIEGAQSPDQAAPQAFSTSDSTAPTPARGIYNPLTWRSEKPARFRGKSKRRTRADAIARKRGEHGRIAPEPLAWLALLAAVLLAEVSR